MADVVLTVSEIARAGVDLSAAKTVVVPANTYYFPNDGNVVLFVNNVTVGACVVTIDIPTTVDGQTVTDRTVSVAASDLEMIGRFPVAQYNNAAGRVKLTFDAAAEINAVHV